MGSTTIVRSEPSTSGRDEQHRPHPEAVRAQLARILASPLFNHSKHYPGLLRYVVIETLEGRGGHLKERALGVAVFGRDPNYDTNADPVVRSSACEVRKRIAQYYHDPEHEGEMRIDLSAGTYVPEFRAPQRPSPVDAAPPVEVAPQGPSRNWTRLLIAVAALTLVGTATELHNSQTAVEKFWSPVWGSSDAIMMGLGTSRDAVVRAADPAKGPTFLEVMRSDHIAFSDALTMARLTGVLRENRKRAPDIRRANAFTLTDLRKGPLILIGAYNNTWTMRLEGPLRYTFKWHAQEQVGFIQDRNNPSKADWRYDPNALYSTIAQDYAIVSRYTDSLTEKMVVVVAGMGRDGTIAAGEFVTDPRYLENLDSRAPKGWEHKNLQVVLATDVVNGTTGPPRILATYFW